MKRIIASVLVVVVALVSGCAPISPVGITASNVDRFSVLEGNRPIASGSRTAQFNLPGNVDHDLVLRSEGYQDVALRLVAGVSGIKVFTYVSAILVLCAPLILALPFMIANDTFYDLEPRETSIFRALVTCIYSRADAPDARGDAPDARADTACGPSAGTVAGEEGRELRTPLLRLLRRQVRVGRSAILSGVREGPVGGALDR